MAQAAYPTRQDLLDLLEDAGLTTTGLELDSAVRGGRQQFERETGRRMLATAQTRTFDPPANSAGILHLGADLLTLTSLSLSGTALTQNTDFRLLPQNAADDEEPYTAVQFLVKRWGSPLGSALLGAVSVVGTWGYGATIPDDAWRAMLQLAAVQALPEIGAALTEGMISWTHGDITEKYGDTPLAGLQDRWESAASRTIARYRRVSVGL